MGRSCGLLGRSWAQFYPSEAPLWAPPGLLWGLLGALPRARGAPRSPKSTKNQQKHEKYRILRGSSWEHHVFARFGFILDPQNVAKSSENAGLPAETSYFTRVLGCIFTLFFEAPGNANTRVLRVFSPSKGEKILSRKGQNEAPKEASPGPKPTTDETESGIRKSCCFKAFSALLRLSGGPTANLSRFSWSGGPTVNLSRFPSVGLSAVNLSFFLWFWWSYGKSRVFRGLVV